MKVLFPHLQRLEVLVPDKRVREHLLSCLKRYELVWDLSACSPGEDVVLIRRPLFFEEKLLDILERAPSGVSLVDTSVNVVPRRVETTLDILKIPAEDLLAFREGELPSPNLRKVDVKGVAWWHLSFPEDLEVARHRLKLCESVNRLAKIRMFVLDMDGTVNLGETPLPGAREFVRACVESGRTVTVITNNSSYTKAEHVRRVRRLLGEGIHVFTSVEHINEYVREKGIRKAFVLLPRKVLSDLEVEVSEEDPDAVLVGFDKEVTYEKLKKATLLLQRGKPFILIHPDKTCPTEEGAIPDVGAISALLETATGRKPDYVGGKPNPKMIETVAKRFGISPKEIMVIGDRVSTDVKMGVEAGCLTGLILETGETKRADLTREEVKRYMDSEGAFVVENFVFFLEFLRAHGVLNRKPL